MNASFSSDELMVTVHTVFGAAFAAHDHTLATQASRAADAPVRDLRRINRHGTGAVFHTGRHRRKGM